MSLGPSLRRPDVLERVGTFIWPAWLHGQRDSRLRQLQAALSRGTPSHAVVDLSRNPSSGLRCVAALCEANAETAIVMLTGFASRQVVAEAIRLGACCCVPKPCDIDDIETALAGVKSGSL